MKLSLEEVKNLPREKLLEKLQKIKDKIKKNDVVQDMFKEYGIDLNEIDLVPICFDDIEVSARTEKGCIYLSWKLLMDGDLEGDDHYLVHEISHWAQQTTGDKPTKGSTDDTYLDNEYEQEGFQNQTEYLSETRGEEAAENYVNQVLDHHQVVNPKEREERKRELLRIKEEALELNLFKLAGRWSSIIRGEWWIDEDGEAIYADQDVGEVGHEAIAADMLLDKDVLIEGLKNHYQKELDSGEIDEHEHYILNQELEDYESDDMTPAAIFFNLKIPNEVGIEAAGSPQIWQDMNKDIRLAYAKHRGAILVINTNFYAWKVTDKTLEAIHSFILEQNEEVENPQDEEILIEEASTHRHVAMPLSEFLAVRHVGELWQQLKMARASEEYKKYPYDPESWYYHWEPGMTLQTIIDRWQKQRPGTDKWGSPLPRQKMYDSSMPVMISLDELWPLREYTRSREEGNRSPEEWDTLAEDMQTRGWSPDNPLMLDIGNEGGVKVGEGNHRLAIAKSLGIREVPVRFIFATGKVSKTRKNPMIPSRSSVIPQSTEVPKNISPEKEKRVEELLKLLGDR